MRSENRALVAIVVAVALVVAGGAALIWLTAPRPSFIAEFCGYGGQVLNKPYVLLNASIPTASEERIAIAHMQPSSRWSAGCYSVNLGLNDTWGRPAPLPVGANGTVSVSIDGTPPPALGPFTIRSTDPDGDGNPGVGDFFTVTHAGGLPAIGNYSFSLVWYDGSALDIAAFQPP